MHAVRFDKHGRGTIVRVQRADVAHEHARCGDIALCSALAPEALEDVADVHVFAFPPPWNHYLVPRDAAFVSAQRALRPGDVVASTVAAATRMARRAARNAMVYNMSEMSLGETVPETPPDEDEDDGDEDDAEDDEEDEDAGDLNEETLAELDESALEVAEDDHFEDPMAASSTDASAHGPAGAGRRRRG